MLKAFDVNQIRRYSLKGDTGENPTVFLLGVIDSRLFYFLRDRSKSFGLNTQGDDAPATINLELDQYSYKVVKYGLRGWENFEHADGSPVKFATRNESIPGVGPRTGLTDQALDFLKPYIKELAEEILKDNEVSEQDEKN